MQAIHSPDRSAVLLQHRSLRNSQPARVLSSLSALNADSLAPISAVGSSHDRLELDALLGSGSHTEDHSHPPYLSLLQQKSSHFSRGAAIAFPATLVLPFVTTTCFAAGPFHLGLRPPPGLCPALLWPLLGLCPTLLWPLLASAQFPS